MGGTNPARVMTELGLQGQNRLLDTERGPFTGTPEPWTRLLGATQFPTRVLRVNGRLGETEFRVVPKTVRRDPCRSAGRSVLGHVLDSRDDRPVIPFVRPCHKRCSDTDWLNRRTGPWAMRGKRPDDRTWDSSTGPPAVDAPSRRWGRTVPAVDLSCQLGSPNRRSWKTQGVCRLCGMSPQALREIEKIKNQ